MANHADDPRLNYIELFADLPIWCSKQQVAEAINRVLPRARLTVERDLRHGLGAHIERRKLGRQVFYKRDDIGHFANALLALMETHTLDARMSAYGKEGRAKQLAERDPQKGAAA